MKHILILEDDFTYRKMLAGKLSKYARVFEADNLNDALKILAVGHLDIAFVDLDLEEDLEGLKFLEHSRGLDTLILSSHDDEKVIDKAFSLGAKQFLNKWDFDEYLDPFISRELSLSKQININDYYQTQNKKLKSNLVELIETFNMTQQPLLIMGETGVGKGELAKSLSSDKPFVHVNLSEFSRGTIESELFGHVKGSFTGALTDKEGLFKRADKGILFLDEIGTLSLELQKKLLRVIDEQAFYPVGSSNIVKVNFRIITATCDDLKLMIEKNQFREDLFYRLNGLSIELPPLNQRTEDIFFFIKNLNKKSPRKVSFTSEAKGFLEDYPWKGNYRELISFVEKIRSVSRGQISLDECERLLPQKIEKRDFLSLEMKSYIKEKGLPGLLESIEKETLNWAISKTKGKVNESIRLLQISKSLYYRIFNSAS